MNVLFETSVLVAAMVASHPRHAASLLRLQEAHTGVSQGFVSTHALAETYATLSVLPLRPRLQPMECQRMIRQNIQAKLKVVPLGAKSYWDALEDVSRSGLSGGILYDGLHVQAARLSGCTRIYTLNLRHFRLVSPDSIEVVEP